MTFWNADFDNRIKKRIVCNTTTLAANNTTASVDIFELTGSVYVTRLWGIVTTVISTNIDAVHLRLDDGSTQVTMTGVAGVDISAFEAGSLLTKELIATGLLIISQADQPRLSEPNSTAAMPGFTDSCYVANPAATTDIEVRFSTTDAPSSGAIEWFAEWVPLSDDGNLAVSS